MSTTIDNRVVQMGFDNARFESGVSTTLKTLGKLKEGLNLEESTKNLSNLSNTAKKFSLAGLSDGVSQIASKFNALSVIGITALANITNAAVNSGKRIVSALTIDPIKQGFSEYELKMGSIQTIMASTGETLQTVNEYLDELNTYADKTIYSFSDMTTNIGKFTNAGVSLDKSVKAIQGISNVAAVSGANTNEASRAMYNFAQALSAGYVKLIDWKSIENANMATVEFKNQLLQTALSMGTVTETSDGMYKTLDGNVFSATKNFNDVLQDQWMTSEVLVETLNKYSDETTEIGKKAFAAAQDIKTLSQMYDTLKESAGSGWAQSWEIITGDYNESKSLFTQLGAAIGGIIEKSAKARNQMLEFWRINEGREALIQGFKNAIEAVNRVIQPVKEALKEFFPPMTGFKLSQLTEKFKKFTESLKIGEVTANNIKRTFRGLFAILDIGKQAFTAIASGLSSLLNYLLPAGDGILNFTGNIGDMFVALNEAIKAGDFFNKAVKKIGDVLYPIGEAIVNVISKIKEGFEAFKNVDLSGLDSFSEKIKARFEPFTKLGELVKNVFDKIGAVMDKITPVLSKFASIVADAFNKTRNAIADALEGSEFNSLFDLLNSGLLVGILIGIKKIIDSFGDFASKGGGFLKNIVDILDGVRGCLKAYQTDIKANALLKIASAIAILAGALLVLSLIDSQKLTSALLAMSGIFVELFGSMGIMQALMDRKKVGSLMKVTSAMLTMSVAVLVLSFAMKNLADLDWNEIGKGLVGVAGLSAILITSANLISKNAKNLSKSAVSMILFGAAIRVLVESVKELGKLDPEELKKGLLGIGALAAGLAAFMKLTSNSNFGANKGVGLIGLAASMLIMAEAVKKFGEMDVTVMEQGVLALAGVLGALAIFIRLTGDSKKVISTALAMTVLGAAMLIFGKAIENMGNLSQEQIAKGLAAMAGALLAVCLAMKALPKNILANSVGLIAVAAAITILGNALGQMGGMSMEQVGIGLTALAGSLLVIAMAMKAMNGALGGAAALLVVAASLAILAPVLKTFGSMSLAEIGKGLLTLVGVFAVLGVAGLVLAPLTPVLLALGGAIALLGIGCAAVGAGLLLFSAGLSALAISGAAGAAALVVVVTTLISLIPAILEQVGYGILAILTVISSSAAAITVAVTTVILAVIAAIVAIIPAAVDAIMLLLTKLLEAIVIFIPQLVTAGMDIIVGVLQGIADKIDDVVVAGVNIILSFLDGIARKIPDVIDAGFDLLLAFINGLTDSIDKNAPLVADAIERLVKTLITSAFKIITAPVGGVLELGKDFVKGLINGIKNKIRDAKDAVKEFGGALLKSFKDFFGIKSPSRLMRDEVGNYIVDGVAEGITSNTSAEEAAEKKATNIVNAFKKALAKADLSTATASLENDLWNALYGNSANDSEILSKQSSLLATKIMNQQEKVALAKGEYDAMVQNVGKDDDKTIESYNKYLQEQIDLANLMTDYNQNQENMGEAQSNASARYYEYLQANLETLEKGGFTLEQIYAAAEQASGYKPGGSTDTLAKSMSATAGSAVQTAMGTVESVYKQEADKTFSGLVTSFGQWGTSYANAIGDNFLITFNETLSKIKSAIDMLDKEVNIKINTMIDNLKNILANMDMDVNPVITPVMDLSEIEASSRRLGDLISADSSVKLAGHTGSVLGDPSNGNGSTSNTTNSTNENNYSFVQNNYSPKALSRIEIYRQTKNQFSALKGMVTSG